ncbi:MAG: YceI family protein [Bacteroidales bacterium]|nr:YceI family protein [Bacteroidales bacterium]
MKHLLIFVFFLAATFQVTAQKYITKTGAIQFYSEGAIEKIEAINKQVNAALDIKSGDMVFKVVIKSFEFEKALMQEHFNENYLESDKFPNASFVGKVINIDKMDFSKDGKYEADITGKITIHGVTKDISTKGSLESKNGKITGHSVFNILVKDFKIEIPGAVVKNIAESIEITVNIALDKLK